MPYVKRDKDKRIIAASAQATGDIKEFLAADNADYIAYYNKLSQEISETDRDMARVLEDLIELLTAKKIISFTEFPPAVQRKLLIRKDLRWQLQNLHTRVTPA